MIKVENAVLEIKESRGKQISMSEAFGKELQKEGPYGRTVAKFFPSS